MFKVSVCVSNLRTGSNMYCSGGSYYSIAMFVLSRGMWWRWSGLSLMLEIFTELATRER